jgi:phosphatidate cytidylyltransferase
MSAHLPDLGRHNDHAPGFRAIRWNMDWITRPLFGIGLALLAIGLVSMGTIPFAFLVAVIGVPASFEWHRMVAEDKPYRIEALVTALTVALACLVLAYKSSLSLSLGVVALGLVASVVLTFLRGNALVWQALGVVYLAIPSIALVSLRAPTNGVWTILGLFVIVWATDSGALICGNLIGGPRLAPVLSPSKTWAGTIGGRVIAALAFAGFIAILGGAPLAALPIGFAFSLVAHGGDLFESFVKRRFGVKNSGAIIPGHGGVLDRMDSTLAAALALAVLVFVFGFNPLIGVHA